MPTDPSPKPGIFITKGLRVGIPHAGLQVRVDRDGRTQGDLTLHVLYDVCPRWLEIACQHVFEAETHSASVIAAWDISGRQEEVAKGLELESASGMQAAVAGAIAMDALYAMVKDRVVLPAGLTRTWKKNRTPRHRQMAEVFRRAFLMDHRTANQLRVVLNDIMRFRDQAVHPSGTLAAPHFHPELRRAMEWRFVTFRFALVKTLVSLSLSTIAQLCFAPKPEHADLVRYCADLRPVAVNLLYAFERRYGRQFERAGNHKGPPEEAQAV